MAAWSLVGAVSAALREGSVEPLRLLAARRDDPNADMRAAAELAGALLADLDKLHAVRSEFQLAGDGQPQPGIPSELLESDPWSRVAAALPEAADALFAARATGPALGETA